MGLRVLHGGTERCGRWNRVRVAGALAAHERKYARRWLIGIARGERNCKQGRYGFGVRNRNQ